MKGVQNQRWVGLFLWIDNVSALGFHHHVP